jgi:hypothetical protein
LKKPIELLPPSSSHALRKFERRFSGKASAYSQDLQRNAWMSFLPKD